MESHESPERWRSWDSSSSSHSQPPAAATIIKSPPWADEFGAKYAGDNGLDTRAAMNSADDRLDAIGYFSTPSTSGTAPKSMNSGHAQADAVWAFFGHGGPGVAEFYDMSSGATTKLYAQAGIGLGCGDPNDCITDHFGGQLSRMKLALFAGCNTADSKDGSMKWDGNLLYAATGGAGVDSAVGFSENISWPSMDYWTDQFFKDLQSGDTVLGSTTSAQAYVLEVMGRYNGTNSWKIWGSTGVRIKPAGYGS